VRVIASLLREYTRAEGARKLPPAERTARLLASAVRGFKHVAANPPDLRRMIEDLIKIALGSGGAREGLKKASGRQKSL